MNETLIRALSGAVYVVLLVTATLYSRESFLLLFGLFLLQTVNEFSNLVKLNKIQALILSVLFFVNFTYFSKSEFSNWILVSISIFTLLLLAKWLFEIQSKPVVFSNWGLLIGYIIIPFIVIAKLAYISSGTVVSHFPHIVIGVFILIWTNDTFAYLVGKNFGTTKLFERISPKKTVEGFLGGMLFAVIAGFIISQYYVTLLPFWQWIVIAVAVSVFGTVGDLVESKFKRIAGVKDSGSIMPGHGGILDRLDSIIFVAPFVYLFLKIIEYVS
ncbi:phosphatidate cytidylyltransferase [Flavobacterium sp. H122]|uniref:phosphatidate cytidylyltransferase n=1 Tax=Flavobacterium sp. H122 TaxID=2529860 RepID=UPI0010AAA12F|nr:phosphatidate cytidylyltransferase [Flavobacterium sp. H122]